jgi:DNA-binding transcriptional ArsR family regulator
MGDERTEEVILRILRESDERVMAASEIIDQVEVSKPTVYTHLAKLVGAEEIESKEVGRTTVYWHQENQGDVTEDETASVPERERSVAIDMNNGVRIAGGAVLGVLLLVLVFANAPPLALVLLAGGVSLLAVAEVVEAVARYRDRDNPKAPTSNSAEA